VPVAPAPILRYAASLRKPPKLLPQYEVRSRLGVPGKTKEGHDCYVHYDKDCTPVDDSAEKPKAAPAPVADKPACHPFDPSCNRFAPVAAAKPAKPSANGVIEPDDPHCDPEFDPNCKLRRVEPTEEKAADEPAREVEPAAAVPHPFAGYAAEAPVPRFEDFLRGYMGQYKK